MSSVFSLEQLIDEAAEKERLAAVKLAESEQLQAEADELKAVVQVLRKRDPTLNIRSRPRTALVDTTETETAIKSFQSFTEMVTTVVTHMVGRDITVGAVFEALNGAEFKDIKEPRLRIGTILQRLEEKGVLARTFKGGGNVPNRYRLKESVDLA